MTSAHFETCQIEIKLREKETNTKGNLTNPFLSLTLSHPKKLKTGREKVKKENWTKHTNKKKQTTTTKQFDEK